MIEDSFDIMKKKQLRLKDKSNAGKIDDKITGLCNKINKNKQYYTTSSCAGRVVLLKGSLDKEPDKFLYRTHKKVSFNELKEVLNKVNYSGLVEFKQSPCILHVSSGNLESAQELVTKAKFAGWKHSGIMSTKKRIMAELRSTEHLAFPIMFNKGVLVNDDFLKLVVKQANLRLKRVWEKIEKLKNSL